MIMQLIGCLFQKLFVKAKAAVFLRPVCRRVSSQDDERRLGAHLPDSAPHFCQNRERLRA